MQRAGILEAVDLLPQSHGNQIARIGRRRIAQNQDGTADVQERYASEANTKNREGLRKEYGADELCTVFASVSVDGEQYWFAMETACYDGVWYNLSLNGNGGALLGLPAYGIGIVE